MITIKMVEIFREGWRKDVLMLQAAETSHARLQRNHCPLLLGTFTEEY
jgi:hypothetical protein